MAAFGLLLAGLQITSAANYVITQTDFVFTPSTLTIGTGDSVTWTNEEAFVPHTSTSGSPPGTQDHLWSGPSENPNTSFTFTFNNFAPRTYPFFCSFHYNLGMVGSLTITNAVPAPDPSLSNPVSTNGHFQFAINGLIGQKYALLSSPDLINWTGIQTNLALSVNFTVTDPSASNSPARFYRVLEVP